MNTFARATMPLSGVSVAEGGSKKDLGWASGGGSPRLATWVRMEFGRLPGQCIMDELWNKDMLYLYDHHRHPIRPSVNLQALF